LYEYSGTVSTHSIYAIVCNVVKKNYNHVIEIRLMGLEKLVQIRNISTTDMLQAYIGLTRTD